MNILSVASEVYPLVKTGGLADVVGALPSALLPHGVKTRTLVPGRGSDGAHLPCCGLCFANRASPREQF